MRKTSFVFIIVLFSAKNINAEGIDFPPELLWWIQEVKKANQNIEINKFTYSGKEIKKFVSDNYYQGGLTYPVFMRWNYSGNFVAYNNYHAASLSRTRSGKYRVGNFDDAGLLYFADKNKRIFFVDSFGVSTGLNAIHWLTDTVLTGVGHSVNNYEKIDLYIIIYKINITNKTVEITLYSFDNAFNNSARENLKLDWYENRPDYFEID
ncbi:MAG: hypothetical protein LBC52_06325 [Treponema sp.]|jgi:hypothetical protein|nr:hypothetical protein [Treponema sp.]